MKLKLHNADEILAAGGIDAYSKKHNIKTDMRKWVGILKFTPKEDKELTELMYGKQSKNKNLLSYIFRRFAISFVSLCNQTI